MKAVSHERGERGGLPEHFQPSLASATRVRECNKRSARRPLARAGAAFCSFLGPARRREHGRHPRDGDARVPMKLKVPDGTEPPVGLAGYRALDGAERTAIRTAYGPDVHVRVEGSRARQQQNLWNLQC